MKIKCFCLKYKGNVPSVMTWGDNFFFTLQLFKLTEILITCVQNIAWHYRCSWKEIICNVHMDACITWDGKSISCTGNQSALHNIFKNRNLHCDIQQLPQLNPTHQAKEYQHLSLSILNTRNLFIIKLTLNQYIILSMFWVLLLITGTTDICNIVLRGAWRGISWQTNTVKAGDSYCIVHKNAFIYSTMLNKVKDIFFPVFCW